jgi:4-hydroxy-tetrahydrodipicolinate synthase
VVTFHAVHPVGTIDHNRLSGAFAALITPTNEHGAADFQTLDQVVDFVMGHGVDGVVVGGGTGEYPHFTVAERASAIARVRRRLPSPGTLIASIGTSSIHTTLQLARLAAEDGADYLLIPMPYFFHYDQDDLAAFCERVCEAVSLPCLLYNLPSFTAGLTVETAVRLVESVTNLVGMKDSSGNPDNLAPLAELRSRRAVSVFVGDDSLLLPALRAGWDGVISGIACCMPDMIVSIYRAFRCGRTEEAAAQQRVLDEFIEKLMRLPIPWGVRLGLETRGIPNGPLHQPVAESRRPAIADLQAWVRRWCAS